MKIVTNILMFIILLLSTVPCLAYDEDIASVSVSASNENTDSCADDCAGKCSPFYCCGACTGFVLQEHNSPDTIGKKVANEVNTKPIVTFYENFIYTLFIGSIWQPPKIS